MDITPYGNRSCVYGSSSGKVPRRAILLEEHSPAVVACGCLQGHHGDDSGKRG